MMIVKKQRRVIVCGSADCKTDVEAVCTSIAQDPLLAYHFITLDSEDEMAVAEIHNSGFRKNDILVLLLGDQYGNAICEGKSPTEHLFDCATDAELLRLVFVKTTARATPRQLEFARKINCLVVRKRFLTTEEALEGVRVALETVILGYEKPNKDRPISNEELMNFIIERLSVPLSRIEGGVEKLDDGMAKLVKNHRPKERKNLNVGSKTMKEVADLWNGRNDDTSRFPRAHKRKISKADLFDCYRQWMVERGIKSVEDLKKVLDNARHVGLLKTRKSE